MRSQANWMEEGENNIFYFSGLEKRRQQNKAVSSLLLKNALAE